MTIEAVGDREYYEASSAQKRLYILNQFEEDKTGYNMPGAIEVEGKLEVEKLKRTFNN